MIKRVSLHASGSQTVATGFTPIRRQSAPAPRDQTRPVSGGAHGYSFIDNAGSTGGTYRLPPKARPHILQGWKSNK